MKMVLGREMGIWFRVILIEVDFCLRKIDLYPFLRLEGLYRNDKENEY